MTFIKQASKQASKQDNDKSVLNAVKVFVALNFTKLNFLKPASAQVLSGFFLPKNPH